MPSKWTAAVSPCIVDALATASCDIRARHSVAVYLDYTAEGQPSGSPSTASKKECMTFSQRAEVSAAIHMHT